MGVISAPQFFFCRTEGASLADEDLVRPPTDSACDHPAPPAGCRPLALGFATSKICSLRAIWTFPAKRRGDE
jgi:hypothetical protein